MAEWLLPGIHVIIVISIPAQQLAEFVFSSPEFNSLATLIHVNSLGTIFITIIRSVQCDLPATTGNH